MDSPAPPTPLVPGRYIVLGIVVFAGTIIAICATWLFSRPKSAPAPPPSVALLFVDSTPGKVGDKLADEITAGFHRIPNYYVAPRAAVDDRKGEEDAAKIGRELNVRHVLECGLTPDQDRIRIVARLVNTSDGYVMWTKTYTPAPDAAPAVAKDIFDDVTELLELKVPQR